MFVISGQGCLGRPHFNAPSLCAVNEILLDKSCSCSFLRAPIKSIHLRGKVMAQRNVAAAVSPILYEQLRAQAKREQKSMSELLREIINRDLLSVPSSDLEKEILAMRLELQRLKSGLLTRTAANRVERQIDEMRAEMVAAVGD